MALPIYKEQPTGLLTPFQEFLNLISLKVGRRTTQNISSNRPCEQRVYIPCWFKSFGGLIVRRCSDTMINIFPLETIVFDLELLYKLEKIPKKFKLIQNYPSYQNSYYYWIIINEISFLNIYKAPNNPSVMQSLMNCTPLPRKIIIGDFNSVFWVW